MVELAALLSFYVAFALLHASHPSHFPVRRWKPTRLQLGGLELVAALATVLGVALWARVEGLTAALLVGAAALSLTATLFVVLAPLAPRLVWGIALGGTALIPVLMALGGHDG